MTPDSLILLVFFLGIGLLVFFSKKRQHPEEKQKELKTTLPWWFLLGLIISAIFIFDPFELNMELIGWCFFALANYFRYKANVKKAKKIDGL